MKATYRRYAKVGPGGVTCPCCGGPARCRHLIKKAARHSFARITDKLADNELHGSVPEMQLFQAAAKELADELRDFDMQVDPRYYDDIGNEYHDYGYDTDDHAVNSTWDFYDNEWAKYHVPVASNHGYHLTNYNTDIWHVQISSYEPIGAITKHEWHWQVTFGHDQYTFDIMESSLEAAFALIQTLHRIDCGSEV